MGVVPTSRLVPRQPHRAALLGEGQQLVGEVRPEGGQQRGQPPVLGHQQPPRQPGHSRVTCCEYLY